MRAIDIYGHVSLPRFMTTEEFLRVMDANGVEHALLSTAQFCPDVHELNRAALRYGDRLRVIGVPLGRSRADARARVRAQLEAGFCGIRFRMPDILDNPDLLDIVGQAGGFPLVVGFRPWIDGAATLHGYLERFPGSFILAGHFACPAEPRLLDSDQHLHRLFAHPRFHVVFSRHGAVNPAVLGPWADALVERLGWGRILWGSEWPVAMWRDESYRSTQTWIDRFKPTEAQRAAFLHDNAMALVFSRPKPVSRPLDEQWNSMSLKEPSVVTLFPGGLSMSETEHLDLMRAYQAWGGGARGSYSTFVRERLISTVTRPG